MLDLSNITEKDINTIVSKVVQNITSSGVNSNIKSSINTDSSVLIKDGIFKTIDDAVNSAEQAFKKFKLMNLDARCRMIQKMREIGLANNELLAKMAVEETGMGRVEHKILKNQTAILKTPGCEVLVPTVATGDNGLSLNELAPFGIICSITPSTNPCATVINNAISMVAAGNVVVFNPHPSAKNATNKAVQLMNQAIQSAGGPPNILTSIDKPTIDTTKYAMQHPKVRLVVVTGGPGVVAEAFKSGKKVIAAGPGNPPVVVDETADIELAGKYIMDGGTFDNNLLCIAEKEIIVINSVANKLIESLKKHGAYLLSDAQTTVLTSKVVIKRHNVSRDYIGKDASYILKKGLNVDVPSNIRGAIAIVDKNHPFVMEELLMPIIPIVKVNTIDEAIETAVYVEHDFRHTAVMHSKNIDNLHKMAVAVDTTIFVKNGPSYAGLAIGGEGYTTLTIATPTGEGLTNAYTFSRKRKCVLKDHFRIV